MSEDKTQTLQMQSSGVNRNCDNCSNTTFSCEKNTIGLSQPKGRHLTSLSLWHRRDELVEKLVNLLNSIKTNLVRQQTLKLKNILKLNLL
jgi:hypothetical protein